MWATPVPYIPYTSNKKYNSNIYISVSNTEHCEKDKKNTSSSQIVATIDTIQWS